MISGEKQLELVAEFPELDSPDLSLIKEVYAHFGLLFFCFSLVENSLINTLTANDLGVAFGQGKITDRSQWTNDFDDFFEKARKLTFGNLFRKAVQIPEFEQFEPRILKAKNDRDYFAHNFFREEVGIYSSDDGCWHILWEFRQLRRELIQLDDDFQIANERLHERLSLPKMTTEQIEKFSQKILNDAKLALKPDQPIFGWMK